MKTKKDEKIVFHNDYGLCKIVKDRIGIIPEQQNVAKAVPIKNLINLNNKTYNPQTFYNEGQRVKDIVKNKFGEIASNNHYWDGNIYVKFDNERFKTYVPIQILEPEDQQSCIDVSPATLKPGHNAFNIKHRYKGVVTDHTIFVEECYHKWKTHCFHDNQMHELPELDVAIVNKNIDMDKFCQGAAVTNAFENMPGFVGTIASNELKGMPGYLLIKHKGKRVNPYQVCHVLETKLI